MLCALFLLKTRHDSTRDLRLHCQNRRKGQKKFFTGPHPDGQYFCLTSQVEDSYGPLNNSGIIAGNMSGKSIVGKKQQGGY